MSDHADTLRVAGLIAGYGRVTVVRDVALNVHSGEIVALLGRNGAGKTTTLAAIAGLRYGPSAGTVCLGEDDLSGFAPHRVSNAGLKLIPAGRRVFTAMTVEENLRLGAYVERRAGRESIARQLAHVCELFPPLAACAAQRAGELSGGQQQMLALGRALMGRARCLLIDEPSAGLAPALVHDLYDRIAELAAAGVGVLVAEPSVGLALERSARYYVMERGALVAEGRSEPQSSERVDAIILGGVGAPL